MAALSGQQSFFCPCGALRDVGPLCRACYYRAWRSKRRFGGHRDAVLLRDGYRCRGCGSSEELHVHHRRAGVHDAAWLITVCAACHATLHRARTLRSWVPSALRQFWHEWHPQAPVQLPLGESMFAAPVHSPEPVLRAAA